MGVIYLLRHGETAWNRAGRMQGRKDSPLTQRGVGQARAMGRLLATLVMEPGTVPIWCSPLGRARQSCSLICDVLGRPPETVRFDDRLIEIDDGSFAGMTATEAALCDRSAWERRRRDPFRNAAPGGESCCDVFERSSAWLAAVDLGDETVVIAHGVFNRMFVAAACGLNPEALLGLPAPQDAIIRISAGSYSLVETDYTD
ncbi:MAG: histidine phosphatase family protein [Alphaproteobacteria bacterium]|nr:histidine phosphatase family protein [Alphaproteobacteria bacterium]